MKLNDIINKLSLRPNSIIMLGAPGSGKTLWLENYINKVKNRQYLNLNISNYSNMNDRSKGLNECIKNKINFIIEGIALKEDRINGLINKLKENNYRIIIVHMNKSIDKILENKKDSIPKYTVKKIHYKVNDFIDKFKDKVDKVIEIKEF